MTWVNKVKTFLNQNIAARLVLYAAALVVPVVHYFNMNREVYVAVLEELQFFDIMWVGFYSCLLLFWACNRKYYEWIINMVLAVLNLIPVLFLCFGSLMVGLLGPIAVLSKAMFPFLDMIHLGWLGFPLTGIALVLLTVMGIKALGDWMERMGDKYVAKHEKANINNESETNK